VSNLAKQFNKPL